jgi:hypothetical protein
MADDLQLVVAGPRCLVGEQWRTDPAAHVRHIGEVPGGHRLLHELQAEALHRADDPDGGGG